MATFNEYFSDCFGHERWGHFRSHRCSHTNTCFYPTCTEGITPNSHQLQVNLGLKHSQASLKIVCQIHQNSVGFFLVQSLTKKLTRAQSLMSKACFLFAMCSGISTTLTTCFRHQRGGHYGIHNVMLS